MSEIIQIIPEKIHIKSIRILSGNINADPLFDTNKVTGYDVQYAIYDEFYPNEKSFKFILSVYITAVSDNNLQLGAKGEYNIEYILRVENIDDYIMKSDRSSAIVLHNILLHTLLSIVYSTSRGIVLSRTQGTSIDGVVLPVIDTNTLLRQLQERQRQIEISEGKSETKP